MVLKRLGKKLNGIAVRLGLKKSGQQQRLNSKTNPPKKSNSAQDNMTDEEKLSANIANDAYNKERHNFGGYEYQKDDSDESRAVYHNKKTGKTRIGYKGTDDLKDLRTDTTHKQGNILHGTQAGNPQYKKDLEHYDKIRNKYGGQDGDYTLSGHSLGSSRSYNTSKNRNIRGHGFNTGRGIDKQMKLDKKRCNEPNPPAFCDKMTSLRINYDPLSVMNKGAYGQHKQFSGNSLNPHSMSNFL